MGDFDIDVGAAQGQPAVPSAAHPPPDVQHEALEPIAPAPPDMEMPRDLTVEVPPAPLSTDRKEIPEAPPEVVPEHVQMEGQGDIGAPQPPTYVHQPSPDAQHFEGQPHVPNEPSAASHEPSIIGSKALAPTKADEPPPTTGGALVGLATALFTGGLGIMTRTFEDFVTPG